jgi:hypothetical protein
VPTNLAYYARRAYSAIYFILIQPGRVRSRRRDSPSGGILKRFGIDPCRRPPPTSDV